MKENWFAILMFSIIFGVLGFLIGRTTCCSPCDHHGHHGRHHQEACCEKGSATCGDHAAHECEVRVIAGEDGEIHMHSDVETIIETLEVSDFVGDTTITTGDAVIRMSKSDDGEIEVNVEVEAGGSADGDEKVMVKTIKVVEDETGEN